MTRILVCDTCGEVLAVGNLADTSNARHMVGKTEHNASSLLESDDAPPADATPEEVIAWAVAAAPEAAEVG